jgi:hypothetical protein
MSTLKPAQWLQVINGVGIDHDNPERLGYYLSALSYSTEQVSDRTDLQDLADREAEHFLGQYESPAEFARESLTNAYSYELEALPTMIQTAIDWAQVWDQDYRHDCLDVEINDPDGYHWLIWHNH